jgi:hypothetical protein
MGDAESSTAATPADTGSPEDAERSSGPTAAKVGPWRPSRSRLASTKQQLDRGRNGRSAAGASVAPSLARNVLLADVLAIAAIHAIACVLARAAGFDHVSDDDFSRVTIAQSFAHAPKLDPSGTSWLPFPFWLLGSFMLVLGRSLVTARGLSIAFASFAATAPYLALRFSGAPRRRALFACAVAFATPWALWLGASTVPESFTASFAAAGAIALGASSNDARRAWPFALAIAAACLSRYEPWPAAAILAVALAARASFPAKLTLSERNGEWHSSSDGRAATRAEQHESSRDSGATATRTEQRESSEHGTAAPRTEQRRWLLLAAAVCTIGPLAWMAWNAHAHDGPLHFFRRVSNYKRAIGEGATDPLTALALYPRLLLTTRPEVILTALALLPTLGDRERRRRWLISLLCAAAQVAFLAYGNVRDGAPAHHPGRALLGPLLILALFIGDVGPTVLQALIERGRLGAARIAVAAILAIWATWIVRGAEIPGRTPGEDRSAQIERGTRLRETHTAHVELTPCSFEHFALLAAFGAPERATIGPRIDAPIDQNCPRVNPR